MADSQESDGNLVAVGIGASAGGLEAFTELLRHLPPATGMAFILVQHLDPTHESALPELLAAKTRMPVFQVHNDTRIEPDHVYIIAPNTLMRIRNRKLTLEARPALPEKFRPIDAFFDSLGQEFGSRAVGIVLSGTRRTVLWLQSHKSEGGVTFAQNQTAKFDSSAAQRRCRSGGFRSLSAPDCRGVGRTGQQTKGTRRAASDLTSDGSTPPILPLLRKHTGVDFAQYKQPDHPAPTEPPDPGTEVGNSSNISNCCRESPRRSER